MRYVILIILIAIHAVVSSAFCATYYVSPNGDDENGDGSEAKPWRQIQTAADVVSRGDQVRIAAGSYSRFTMKNSGDSNERISFVGYNSTFGDLDDGSGMPWEYEDIDPDADGQLFDTHAYDGSPIPPMPEIDGDGGAAIDFSGHSYIELHNLEVFNFQYAVHVRNCQNSVLENMYIRTSHNFEDRYARGILLENAEVNSFINCVCYNAGQQAVTVGNSNRNVVYDCMCFCDADGLGGAVTHYYFIIAGDSTDNSIVGCLASRQPDPRGDSPTHLSHTGQGFCCQARMKGEVSEESYSCFGNRIADCVARNIGQPFIMRGNAFDNVVQECESVIDDSQDTAQGYLAVNHGAHDNVFQNTWVRNAKVGIHFESLTENYDSDLKAENNTFVNCVLECRVRGFELRQTSNDPSMLVRYNLFLNCNFVALEPDATFFMNELPSDENHAINCIIKGFSQWDWGSIRAAPDFTYDYSCFFGNGTSFPDPDSLGGDNVQGDPLFYNLDYDIPWNSPCVDKGSGTEYENDIDGDPRDATVDIGAQEYLKASKGRPTRYDIRPEYLRKFPKSSRNYIERLQARRQEESR